MPTFLCCDRCPRQTRAHVSFVERTTYPGPTMPYVIPRLLDMPGMVATVTAIPDAFAVSYFAARKPKIELLTAPWPRTDFSYTTQMSIDSWRIPNDVWDFDLAPWLARGNSRLRHPLRYGVQVIVSGSAAE